MQIFRFEIRLHLEAPQSGLPPSSWAAIRLNLEITDPSTGMATQYYQCVPQRMVRRGGAATQQGYTKMGVLKPKTRQLAVSETFLGSLQYADAALSPPRPSVVTGHLTGSQQPLRENNCYLKFFPSSWQKYRS